MEISLRPTVFLSRYRDRVSTMYSDRVARSNRSIVYSTPYEVIWMTSLPGVFRLSIFLISHGMPKDIKMARELAPSEFETPIPPSPLRTDSTLEMPSGMQPPAARKVRPMTASGTRMVKPEGIWRKFMSGHLVQSVHRMVSISW